MMSRSDILIELQILRGFSPTAARVMVKRAAVVEGATTEWLNGRPDCSAQWTEMIETLKNEGELPKQVVGAIIMRFLEDEMNQYDKGIQKPQLN